VVVFGSFDDCAGESIMNCLQAFHLRRVDVVKRVGYSRRVWNEQLKWLSCTRSCSQVVGAIVDGHECVYSRCEIAG
jgi:hypothetical protein